MLCAYHKVLLKYVFVQCEADLMSNSVRNNPPTQDFQTVLGDAPTRHSLQGMDSSFNLMVSVPSNVYPPIVPSSLPRDVQTKVINSNSMHALNEARVHEMQSKVSIHY